MYRLILPLLCLPALLFGQPRQAPTRDLINFGLKADLAQAEPGTEFPVYLRGDVDAIFGFVREHGGAVKAVFNNIVSVRLPASAFSSISAQPGITCVEYDWAKGEMLSDVALITNNVAPVHAGVSPLPEAYKGKDVIMAFIDSGIELDHPDFQHEDGSTRVIALWDHTQAANDPQRVPQPFNYGQEWTAEDINAGISNHVDQAQWSGHGSTVSGVGVGNGNATGDFVGVAPEADIIVVSTNFALPNWTSSIADAIEWILARAEAIGKPVVINASLGTYLGSHDALDAAALRIETLLDAAPGRALVSAAGNANDWAPWHLGYDIPETDTAFTWFRFNPDAFGGQGAVFLEAWADVEGFENTRFTFGADVISPSFAFRGYAGWRSAQANLDVIIQDTIRWNNAIIGVVQTWVGQRGDQYQIQMVLTQPFSNQYRWRLATTGGGRIDVWSRADFGLSDMVSTNLPGVATYPPMAHYRLPDKLQTMVSSWACSDKVVTVANYTNQETFETFWGTTKTYPPHVVAGLLSINSSAGPTRDQRLKPDLAATGDVVLGSGRLASIAAMMASMDENLAFSGMHFVNGGTSMASPIVAGTAALFFERCPNATYHDFKEAVVASALADLQTGALPTFRWGQGKLDAFGTLLKSIEPIPVFVPIGNHCEGTEVLIGAEEGYTNYLWSNGQTGPVLTITEGGVYSLTANDAKGCLQSGSTIDVQFQPAPPQPLIIFESPNLIANGEANTWQWYFEGVAIPGATAPSFTPEQEGIYQVSARNMDGCATLSEEFVFGVASATSLMDGAFHIYPNPSQGAVYIAARADADFLRITDVQGKLLHERSINLRAGERLTLDLPNLPQGIYVLGISHKAGVHHTKLALEK